MTGSEIKRICGRLLFVGELMIFTWVYFYGAHGFMQLASLRAECMQIELQKNEKAAEIKKLQDRIIAWNVHSFEKEKLAREQLQMAKKDEIIYLMS